MGYNIFVTDLTEEIRSLTMAILKIKAEEGAISPEERELLERLRSELSSPTATARKARATSYPQGNGRAS